MNNQLIFIVEKKIYLSFKKNLVHVNQNLIEQCLVDIENCKKDFWQAVAGCFTGFWLALYKA